jgi:hypothetical protein
MSEVRRDNHGFCGSLEKGQIWVFGDECLAVKHVGKHLVEFRITKKHPVTAVQRHLRVPNQLESIKTLSQFLQLRKAVLGRGCAAPAG